MGKAKNNFLFIVNPISGKGNKNEVVQAIQKGMRGTEFEIAYTEYPKHAIEIAKKAVEEKYYCVVAVGGDGSVNEVGQSLIGSKTMLGIVPCGSGNGLALHLKISLNAKKAIEQLKNACERKIDTVSINGKSFLSIAGIGFDAHIGWKFAEFGKRGFLSYAKLSAREFFQYQAKEYLLEIDGKEMISNAFLISFTKSGQFGNNVWIDPKAQLDDGHVSICILEKFPYTSTLDILYRSFSKKLEKSKYFRIIKAKEIVVKKGYSLLHLDGEPENSTEELHIKVQPKSLKLLC